MFAAFDQAYALAGRSLATLKKDPEMLAYPVLSVFFTVVFCLLAALSWSALPEGSKSGSSDDLSDWVISLALYALVYCNLYFWDVALLSSARMRLQGGNPTFVGGLVSALGNLRQIVSWGVLAATVGIVIDLVQRSLKNSRWFEKLVSDLWSVSTYFVLPVMVFEKLGPLAAVKRSREIVAQTWGQALTGYVGLSALYEVFLLPAGLLAGLWWVLAPQFRSTILCLVIPYAVLVCIYLSALEQIYRAGVYLQALAPSIEPSPPLPLGAVEPSANGRMADSCPRCFEPLKVMTVEGVSVDLCDRCGGLWLDKGEAETLLSKRPLPDFLTRPAARQDSVEFRRQGQRECPRCSTGLQLSAVEGVQLDGCARCGGVFLDRGELDELQQRV